MNGLASLLRYQMGGPIGYMSGGPIGYATGGDIEAIYDTLFGRPPDKDGLAFYTKELAGVPLSVAYDRIAGGAQDEDDKAALEANKADLLDKIVENIYREQLGRPADEAGKDFYVQQLASGKTATDLSNEIDRTLEGYNFDAERIASNYRQEFGRNPDQEGFQYYMSQEDALVGKADDKAVTDAIRGGVKGVDVEALAAKPDTGYTQLQLEALGSDPYAGRYATVDPYYFDGVPDDAVNVSRNALDQSIQFTNPVYEQPIVSWFDQNKGFQTTAGEQGDFQQFQGLTGNNVLQREDVENAINLSLKSGALDEKTAANLRDRIDPASENKATSWNELYQILKEPKATVVLNAMGVQVGEDVSATEALKESNTRKQLANIAAENIGGNPSALYQFTLADNIANITGENVDDIYPFSSKNLGLGSIDTKKTTADVFNNVATELGIPADKEIVRAPTISTPATQRATPFTFAPLRRGLGQLRPAMSMPGLTSGQAAFGSPASTPGQPLNNLPISAPATPYALPEDFVLQTGAYNTRDSFPSAFTPFTSSPSTVAGNTAAGPAGVDQPTYAQLLDNVQRLSAQVETLSPANQSFYGSGGDGGFGDPSPSSGGSVGPAGGDPSNNPSSGFTGSVSGVGSPGDDEGTGSPAGDFEVGGLIRMAEGGEPPTPPPMSKLSPSELGSTFDIADYIDDQGRLVGGYSKPIYDENRVITGYEYRPYERDVVFNPRLREREAMGVSPEEQEMALRAMIARQGLTGVNPMTGGLPGIMPREAVMRRRPDYNFAEGGIASVAQNLADKGRKGDSMLVHMTPDEVAGLQALAQQMGGSLTINPQTGLPEANIFKKLLPMALGFALGPAGAGLFQSALSAGLAVGAGYTLATGSLQQGISAGLGAYGGSNLGTGLQAAGADAATSAAASDAASSGLQVAGGAGGAAAEAAMVNPMAHPDFAGTITPSGSSVFDLSLSPNYSVAAPGAAEGVSLGTTSGFQASLPEVSSVSLTSTGPTAGSVATGLGGGVAPAVPTTTTLPIETVQIGGPQAGMRTTELATVPQSTSGSAFTGAERYFGDKATRDLAAADYAAETGSTLGTSLMQIAGGAAGQSAAEEQEVIKAQQAAIDDKRERRRRLAEEVARRALGRVTVKSGGLMKLAGGGMSYMEAGGTTGPTGAPREVVGNGDGMSDSVPADIEGVQEARLADGEFVIPADVVADIGNGSSDAGSKKLYDMMDRVRKARHGTTEQPPEIQAERLMPA
jgi:hypothetical protein